MTATRPGGLAACHSDSELQGAPATAYEKRCFVGNSSVAQFTCSWVWIKGSGRRDRVGQERRERWGGGFS